MELETLRDFIKRCGTSTPAVFGNVCLDTLKKYLATNAPPPPGYTNGFNIPAGKYLSDTREAVTIPKELENPMLLALIRKGDGAGAQKWIDENLNQGKTPPKYRAVPWVSADIPSPDDNNAVNGRFLIYKKADPSNPKDSDQFINFAMPTPGEVRAGLRPKNVSVVATMKAPDSDRRVVVYRDNKVDSSQTHVNLGTKIGAGTCFNCHRPPVLQIFPDPPLTGKDAEILESINSEIRGFSKLLPYGREDIADLAPPTGYTNAAIAKARTPEFVKRFADAPDSRKPAAPQRNDLIIKNMDCARCHVGGGKVMPLDVMRTTIESGPSFFAKHVHAAQMPPDADLTDDETKTLVRALTAEQILTREDGPSALAEWLKAKDCGGSAEQKDQTKAQYAQYLRNRESNENSSQKSAQDKVPPQLETGPAAAPEAK